jgi:hypothetical protein
MGRSWFFQSRLRGLIDTAGGISNESYGSGVWLGLLKNKKSEGKDNAGLPRIV